MTYIWLGCAQLELDKTDFCLFDPSGPTSSNNNVLIEDNAIYQLRVFNRSTNLLHDTNITKIDV